MEDQNRRAGEYANQIIIYPSCPCCYLHIATPHVKNTVYIRFAFAERRYSCGVFVGYLSGPAGQRPAGPEAYTCPDRTAAALAQRLLSVVRHNDTRMGDSRLRTILNSVHAERMGIRRIALLQVHRIRPAPARAILRSRRRFGMLFLRYLATALTPVLS